MKKSDLHWQFEKNQEFLELNLKNTQWVFATYTVASLALLSQNILAPLPQIIFGFIIFVISLMSLIAYNRKLDKYEENLEKLEKKMKIKILSSEHSIKKSFWVSAGKAKKIFIVALFLGVIVQAHPIYCMYLVASLLFVISLFLIFYSRKKE